MGYRSDVEIVFYPIKKEEFPLLKLYVDENLPDEFEVGEATPSREWPEGNKYLHCRIEGVKWYDSYEEVDVYNRCFAGWEDMFGSPPKFIYEFMRVGEDVGDVEHRSAEGSNYVLQVETSITLNF